MKFINWEPLRPTLRILKYLAPNVNHDETMCLLQPVLKHIFSYLEKYVNLNVPSSNYFMFEHLMKYCG